MEFYLLFHTKPNCAFEHRANDLTNLTHFDSDLPLDHKSNSRGHRKEILWWCSVFEVATRFTIKLKITSFLFLIWQQISSLWHFFYQCPWRGCSVWMIIILIITIFLRKAEIMKKLSYLPCFSHHSDFNSSSTFDPTTGVSRVSTLN